MARVMMYLMGTSGAETLSTAANVFMGQTEAPLIIKPYISKMTQSELLALMVGGMATVAGSVMVAYISLGADRVGILATSVMAAPCSLYLAKLLLPETEQPETGGGVNDPPPETSKYLTRPVAPPQIPNSLEQRHANFIDAAAGGASDGLRLALNVAAMLIAFLALLAMANYMLSLLATNESLWTTLAADIQDGWILVDLFALVVNFAIVVWLMKHVMEYFRPGSLEKMSRPQKISGVILLGLVFLLLADLFLRISPEKLQLEDIFGVLFSPLAFLIGTNPKDIPALAELLGIKLAANEFVAFLRLQELKATMDHRSHVLATYALTGFANFGSVGIQIGGIGALAPERRPDLARLGIPAMLIGFLVTSINAAVAGVFLD